MHVSSGVIILYLIASFLRLMPLLRAILAFPAVYIAPGLLLLFLIERRQLPSVRQLVIESFIVSTVLNALLIPLFALLGIPITEGYSIFMVLLLFTAMAFSFTKRKSVSPSNKLDYLIIFIIMLTYALMIVSLSSLPRLFTPDETDYISNARAALNGEAYTMGVTQFRSDLIALLSGRFFWTFLLASFLVSTGLQPHEAYLIGPMFLAMVALALTLLVPRNIENEERISLVVPLLILTNPLLILFSGISVLNDLAIAFYASVTLVFFAKSFTSLEGKVSLETAWLLKALILIVIVILIKPSLMVFFGMWIWLAYIGIRYKLYKSSMGHKALFMLLVALPIAYELLIDIPYVIAVWFLRNEAAGIFLQRFIFESPMERILSAFIPPWWQMGSTALLTQGSVDHLDYLYTILAPESLGLPIASLALVLPTTLLLKYLRKNIQLRLMVFIITLSLVLFYITTVGHLEDISRYTLFIVPPLILLAAISFYELFSNFSTRTLFFLSLPMVTFLWVNHILSCDRGGVLLGYGIPRLSWTYNVSVLIFFSFMSLVLLLTKPQSLEVKLKLCGRAIRGTSTIIRKAAFYVFVLILISSNLFFSPFLISHSSSFEDHGLTYIGDVVDKYAENGVVIANNYIYLRPYVSDKLLFKGLFPAPITEDELYDLIKMAPNGTVLLISNDEAASYGFANTYINKFSEREIIASGKPSLVRFPRLKHKDAVLNYTFDEINETEILDQSGYANNGVIQGTKLAEGYYRNALRFSGQSYISIRDDQSLNIYKELTIDFIAFIERPGRYALVSKGYPTSNNASMRGGYYVGTSDQWLYWELGDSWSLSTPISEYVGNWHHFIFTYDGKAMKIFVDGSLVAEKAQNGLISITDYPLEIGRDSMRKIHYFEGLIDELTISPHTLNTTDLVSQYFNAYALRIYQENLPKGELSIYRIVNSVNIDDGKSDNMVNRIDIQYTQRQDIIINVDVFSERPTSITTFIGADDGRFLKIYNTTLQAGSNSVGYWFNYSSPYKYRLSLTHPRIFIIDDRGRVAYDGVINKFNVKFIQLGFIAITVAVICLYLLSSKGM